MEAISKNETSTFFEQAASSEAASPHSLPFRLSRKLAIWGIVAVIHLFLVAFGATMIPLPNTAGFKPLNTYGKVSGAFQGYNYFAPEITSELRARFEITNSRGELISRMFSADVSRETQLRFNNIVGEWGEAVHDKKTRQTLAANWAAKMFNRFPEARKVTVVLETYQLPSMKEFREGVPVGWELFYSGSFVRQNSPS